MTQRCSVALCTFNGARFLGAQLDSLLRQTRSPDELVIYDDHSEDGTWELIEQFRTRSGIPVIAQRNPENVGFVRNFSEAIAAASGDIIFLCDQDDVWYRDKLAVFEETFRSNPQLGMAFGDADLIDALGEPYGQTAWQREIVGFSRREQGRWVSSPEGAVERLIRRNVVTGSTMAFRRRYLDLVLPVPEWDDRQITHDYWIALLIGAVAPTLPIPGPKMAYRLHGSQTLGLNAPQRAAAMHTHILAMNRLRLTAAADRLTSCSSEFPCRGSTLDLIQDKSCHLEMRLSMGTPLRRRVRQVWRELRTGRYSRYSSGLISAAVDLFPGVRTLGGRGAR